MTQPYEVFVQWKRGGAHEHAVTVTASDREMALTLAKRNVDVRGAPVSIWVTPRSEIAQTSADDPTLAPSIEREYRNVSWYARERQ
ncbi:phenylacetic acid degradation protein PaaB [Natronobiforma cellulositropha]|uniref:phenylacetic acid degradation protein PaaB n=1 Tax=Natronobiforma cellulositropha TaxID=1679076 RepID=UPI0021D5EB75|nr:phenylacetic acid degradation protein PaaB [Natronobiforma cellulositropha]